jgi:penicillin-binding protein 2
MTARMVNGGKPITPRILADTPRPDLSATPPIADLDHLERIKQSMIGVVHEPGGTAFGRFAALKGLDLPGDIRAGGKTGTSQVRNITVAERARGVFRNEDLPWRRRDHALFVAFAPADAPRYAMALIVEHGGSGSAAAAPPARDILRETVRLGLKLDAPPTPIPRPA